MRTYTIEVKREVKQSTQVRVKAATESEARMLAEEAVDWEDVEEDEDIQTHVILTDGEPDPPPPPPPDTIRVFCSWREPLDIVDEHYRIRALDACGRDWFSDGWIACRVSDFAEVEHDERDFGVVWAAIARAGEPVSGYTSRQKADGTMVLRVYALDLAIQERFAWVLEGLELRRPPGEPLVIGLHEGEPVAVVMGVSQSAIEAAR